MLPRRRGGRKSIEVRAKSAGGSTLEIHLDKPDGPLVGRVKVGQGADWSIAKSRSKKIPAGVHDLIVTQPGAETVEVDWVSFR